jgi:hypothetical protein
MMRLILHSLTFERNEINQKMLDFVKINWGPSSEALYSDQRKTSRTSSSLGLATGFGLSVGQA